MARPKLLVAVAGTGTEVGKTWTTCRLLEMACAQGLRGAARKPAQSFSPGDKTDADELATAGGETALQVCPKHRWYPIPMAPPMAADVLGREQIAVASLLHETVWPSQLDLGFIETAGGLRSPIAHNADNVELIRRVLPDEILLIADAGLGTINSVRLSLDALDGHHVRIFLNRFDADNDLHVRNHRWLVDAYGFDAFHRLEEWFARR
jgi:dethiobiotin synthetase